MAVHEAAKPSKSQLAAQQPAPAAKPAQNAAKARVGTTGYAAGVAALKPPAPAIRDLPDPGVVLNDEKQADGTTKKVADPYAYEKNTRGATLYGPNGVQASDVRQGAIGDCYLVAALAAVANSNPKAIQDAIKDNRDGTYTVRFYEVGWGGSKSETKVTVDADLPANYGSPAYAKSTEKVDGKPNMELWPSLLEKAYAQWKGSYNAIGHGGVSGDVMEALTGNRSQYSRTSGGGDALWDKVKKAAEAKKPMTAGSGDKDDPKYKDPKAGVYGWHAYTVLNAYEKKEGDKTVKYVTLRNPWAVRRRSSDAAAVGDTTNDTAGGVFDLTWDEFRRLYDDVSING
jgi:hypothetical protein